MSIHSRSRPRVNGPTDFDTAPTVHADAAVYDPIDTWNPPYDGAGIPPVRRPEELSDSDSSRNSADTEDENTPPPARRRRLADRPMPGGPQLLPSMRHAIVFLPHELTTEIRGRERFAATTPADIHLAAETFPRYRLTSLAVIRQTDASDRRMFLSDLRELGRRSFPEMQLITQLLSQFTPWSSAIAPMRMTILAKKLFFRGNFAAIPLTSPLWVHFPSPTS